MKLFLLKFLSRKLLITVGVLFCNGIIPLLFKAYGVSDSITMESLGILTICLGSYHIANVKDAQDEKKSPLEPTVPGV